MRKWLNFLLNNNNNNNNNNKSTISMIEAANHHLNWPRLKAAWRWPRSRTATKRVNSR
jgi:hypothetical protein